MNAKEIFIVHARGASIARADLCKKTLEEKEMFFPETKVVLNALDKYMA